MRAHAHTRTHNTHTQHTHKGFVYLFSDDSSFNYSCVAQLDNNFIKLKVITTPEIIGPDTPINQIRVTVVDHLIYSIVT